MTNRALKDSGVEWIGAIPEDWEILKYKRFAKSGMGSTLLKEDVLISEEPNSVPVYSATQTDKHFGYLQNPKIVLEKGDLVIPARGNSIGNTKIIKEAIATCTQTTIYSKLNNKINNSFLYYCSIGLKKHWFFFVQTAIPQITVSEVQNNLVPFTSIKEQQKIATFLDGKVAHINNIIEDTKKSIENLKSYKQSLITETVTKGLDSDVEMKKSGIEWIGEIPKHWNITRLGRVFEVILGKMLSPNKKGSNWTEERYLSAANVHFYGVKTSNLKTMWFSPNDKQRYRVKYGDLLIVEGGAGAGGSYVFVENSKDIYVQNSINIVRSKDGIWDTKFAYYLMHALVKNGYIDFVSSKATIPHFTKEKVQSVPFPVISDIEKKQIVEYLDGKSSQVDQIVCYKEKLITELESYKKSLIYEYVTGKKEVK